MKDPDKTTDGPEEAGSSGFTETSAPPTQSRDSSIEGYQILRELHRGGQGVVYEAFEQSTKRKVAIKLLLGGQHASKTAQKRFEREIELVAQLRHPNIISIFSSGETKDGLSYYAMDYVRGRQFDEYVRKKRLPLEGVLELFATICDAVQHAHHRGVIHRDLKPGNVLVDSDGSPKVLDFGLAKLMAGSVDTVVSMTEQVMGTVRYMSPEQAAGSTDEIDTRTDVYSLGVMLYEVLTGRTPYPVEGRINEVLTHITGTPPKPPTSQWDVASGVTHRSSKKTRSGECPIDRDLQTIVLKCLAKERDRRYQSAGELARDLRHYVAGEAIEARRDSSVYVIRTTMARFARRYQLLLSLGLAAAIVVAGSVGYFYYKAARDRELLQEGHRSRAEVIVREAVVLQNDGDLTGAEQRLEEALLYDPDSYKALGNLAIVKKDAYFSAATLDGSMGRLEESNVLCDRALAIKPDSAGLWNVKCVVLFSMNRLDDAEKACRRAVEADPSYYWAQSNLAKALLLQERFDDALRAAEGSIRTAQANDGAGEHWAAGPWRALGALQMLMNDPRAKASFESALECNPTDSWTRALLGWLQLKDGEHSDPAEALRNVVVANEIGSVEDARMKQIVARASLANDRFEEAVRYADECLRLDGRAAACQLISSVALARMSEPAAAIRRFDAALAVWPTYGDSGVRVDLARGVIWSERASELEALCELAAGEVGRSCAR